MSEMESAPAAPAKIPGMDEKLLAERHAKLQSSHWNVLFDVGELTVTYAGVRGVSARDLQEPRHGVHRPVRPARARSSGASTA